MKITQLRQAFLLLSLPFFSVLMISCGEPNQSDQLESNPEVSPPTEASPVPAVEPSPEEPTPNN